MHARVFTFSLGPGSRDVATKYADDAYKMTKTLKGFVSATYLIFDDAAGEYGAITVWETEADAAAAGQTLGNAFGDRHPSPPNIKTAEVYEPR
jgi:hypothetical protein